MIFLVIFTFFLFFFFHFFFYENINQVHNLLPDCAFGPFTCAYCENFMLGFSAFVLNLSLAIFCFRSVLNGNFQFSSASLSLFGDNSLGHVMGSCWIHVPEVLFHVFDKLKNEIENVIVRFCFYLNMKNKIRIFDYHFLF